MENGGINTLVSKYIEMRDIVSAADKLHKEKTQQYKDAMERIGMAIQKELNRLGADSMKTPSGTAFIATKDSVSINDWDAVLEYARESGEFEMFNRVVNKAFAKEYMKENNGDQLPGTEYGQKYEVQVRKPK